MRVDVLRRMVEEGKKPVVRIMPAWVQYQRDQALFGEPGMTARVVAVDLDYDANNRLCLTFDFDYNEFMAVNAPLMGNDWVLVGDEVARLGRTEGNAFESGERNPDDVRDDVCFPWRGSVAVELAE